MKDPILWYVIAWFVLALVPCGYWQYRGGELGPALLYLYGWIFLPLFLAVMLVCLAAFLPVAGVAWCFHRRYGEAIR